jgi:hypothetical protein
MPWCAVCDDCRWICEGHPGRPWLGDRACICGGGGMPCPICNPSDEVTAPAMPEGFEVYAKNNDKYMPNFISDRLVR